MRRTAPILAFILLLCTFLTGTVEAQRASRSWLRTQCKWLKWQKQEADQWKQFDADMAEKVKGCWELLKEVRFMASLDGLDANNELQNAEAFFGRVKNKLAIVIVGDAPEEGESVFFAFVEAPELLCRLGRTEEPH